ncbi:MAG: hypothetical protein V1734_01940 [Nanoarchaeota archaeon]
MAKKKTKSFTKHVYALVAIVVLLVAAGIASYAVVPPGTNPATHGMLYTDTIAGKSGFLININDRLSLNGASMDGGYPLTVNTGALQRKGIKANTLNNEAIAIEGSAGGTNGIGVKGITSSTIGGIGVEGTNEMTSTTGKLGTSVAGVEGTTTNSYGVMGTSTNSYGVLGTSTKGHGVVGSTSDDFSYGGQFFGGGGLYASKISFGSAAFDNSDGTGLLILGAEAGTKCGVPALPGICQKHGLDCRSARFVNGDPSVCDSATGTRYCWCGQA